MTISFVGAGTMDEQTSNSLTPVLPTHSAGDLLVVFLVDFSAGTVETTWTSSGWQLRKKNYDGTFNNRWSQHMFWKVAGGSESNPTFTRSAGTVTEAIAAAAAWSGLFGSNPWDGTAASGNNAAQQTFAPPSFTTNNANARVISFVASLDDNALALSVGNEQGFTGRMTGGGYDTTLGSDESLGMADKAQASPGSVTICTWNQTTNNNDAWMYITDAFYEDGLAGQPFDLRVESSVPKFGGVVNAYMR